ncbi:MAG: hypothetical protein AVO35_12805 [Candidatus Aegiribacteria sp. MLS_C]|nr:MAG: hypothetical protein AVO35_12805 [Candidatus Aegiribacteria sp. MLS_C]
MKETATVKIFLAQGDPASVRTAEISNWTGKAIAGPRSQLELVLKREEAGKPGIYFLTGVNPETGRQRVYIGEAEAVRSRIKSHLDRDFWKTIIIFISKDENLTKAHIKYLEGKLIAMAKEADRCELENTNASGSHLPESEAADMDVFLAKVEQLLSVLGQDFLKLHIQATAEPVTSDLMHCTIKNVRATGKLSDNGFIVTRGSEAVLTERPSVKKYPYPSMMRSQLIADGVLIRKQDKFLFAKDYEFSSPSAAASVVQGGQANGLRQWKNGAGVSLKELEQKELEQHYPEEKKFNG